MRWVFVNKNLHIQEAHNQELKCWNLQELRLVHQSQLGSNKGPVCLQLTFQYHLDLKVRFETQTFKTQ